MKWIKIISPLLVLFIVIGVNLQMKDYNENAKIKSFLAKGEWG